MNKAFLAAVVLGQLSFGIATPALAGGTAGPRQVSVQYSDLNLQSAAGQRALKRRLTKAAQSVCPTGSSADRHNRVARYCVTQAVGRAMATLDERQLARASAVNADRG